MPCPRLSTWGCFTSLSRLSIIILMSIAPPSLPPELPKAGPRKKGDWLFPAISAGIFAVSCALPCLAFDNGDYWLGARILALGWSGLFVGQFAWFANLALLASWATLYRRMRIATLVLSLGALAVSCDTWTLYGQRLPTDEGGVNHFMLTAILPGCYVWMSSMVVVLVGVLWPRPRLH